MPLSGLAPSAAAAGRVPMGASGLAAPPPPAGEPPPPATGISMFWRPLARNADESRSDERLPARLQDAVCTDLS